MTGWYDGSYGWAGWIAMGVLMLAFWALLIFGALALFNSFRRNDRPLDRPAGRSNDAQRLLDDRFARGDIDEDDYAQRRELLSSGR